MPNGLAVKTHHHGVALINFSRVGLIVKSKTEGTSYFSGSELDKDAVRIELGGWVLWVTDPAEMERVWSTYSEWIEGKWKS